MPVKRILLTVADVKEIIAKEYKTISTKIEPFEGLSLALADVNEGYMDLKNEDFIFQVDE